MTDTATPAAYLTQEAYDRLKGELTQLSGEGRSEISKKIEAARDEGDLKENGGYHAAKEEQGKMEARIRQLTQLLDPGLHLALLLLGRVVAAVLLQVALVTG